MSKIQDFMGKRNFFFSGPENIEKINKYRLSNIELVLTHTVSELDVLGIAGKLSVPFVTLYKKFKKIENLLLRSSQNPIDHYMVDRNFKG